MGLSRKALLTATMAALAALAVWLVARDGQGAGDGHDGGIRLADARLDGGPFFSPSSFWNQPLPAKLPPRQNSAGYVEDLVRQVGEAGSWINTNEYSVPVYTVGPKQPRVKVSVTGADGGLYRRLEAAVSSVPIPPHAHPSTGTDAQLVVWQPSTDKMWEFWQLRRSEGGWVAGAAGAMRQVSHNPGYFDSRAWPGAQTWWGATATALPLAGGLIRIDELEAGHIDHALALAVPEPGSGHVWPAQRSDGNFDSPNSIPEGTTFRLPPNLDIARLRLPPVGRMIAEAAQRYGIILRDGSGDVSFYAEDPTPTGHDPYRKLFGGQSPAAILAHFPWSKLVAVRQPRHGG
ncbi:MAG: hypothetical protein JSS97_06550 [Actinobacteria bacterium]|nr:hypothetical protein [Actinomycetota bacterium]